MIRKLYHINLHDTAALHTQVLSNTLNSKIGIKYIEFLYNQIINNPSSFSFVYLSDNKKVVGFISGCFDYFSFRNYVSGALDLNIKYLIILHLLKHPNCIIDLIYDFFFYGILSHKYTQPYPTILTLGVHPDYQKRGIGSALFMEMKNYLQKNGIKKVFVDTRNYNNNAVKFYYKLKFNKVDNFLDYIIFENNF